jgi:hypothetical protein
MTDETPLRSQSEVNTLTTMIKSDFFSYLNEYGFSFGDTEETRSKEYDIVNYINQNDVVVFAKKGITILYII